MNNEPTPKAAELLDREGTDDAQGFTGVFDFEKTNVRGSRQQKERDGKFSGGDHGTRAFKESNRAQCAAVE
jgi:hypothetical protein